MSKRLTWPDDAEVGRLGAGEYMVEGIRVFRLRSWWFTDVPDGHQGFATLKEAIDYVCEHRDELLDLLFGKEENDG